MKCSFKSFFLGENIVVYNSNLWFIYKEQICQISAIPISELQVITVCSVLVYPPRAAFRSASLCHLPLALMSL